MIEWPLFFLYFGSAAWLLGMLFVFGRYDEKINRLERDRNESR